MSIHEGGYPHGTPSWWTWPLTTRTRAGFYTDLSARNA